MSTILKDIPNMEARTMTTERMQHEYDYSIAQGITKSLLDKGMISKEEFDKISALNRDSFSPYLAELMR